MDITDTARCASRQAQTVNGKGEQIVGLKVCVKYEPEVILSMQRGTFTILETTRTRTRHCLR